MEAEQLVIDTPVVAAVSGEVTNSQELRRGLAVGRAYYFIMFVGIASLASYMNVHFVGLGITPTQLGIIGALTAIVGMVATPIWAAAADARQWHRMLLLVATVATGVIAIAYLGVNAFAGALVVTILHSIARAPVPVMLDTSVIALAVKSGASYPRQRVWGTIGFAVGGAIAAWLAARFGFSSIVWLQFLAFAVILTVLTWMLPIERSTEKVDYWQGLKVLLRSRPYRGLVIFMLGLGITGAINISYGVLHIFSNGGSPSMVSMMFLLTGVFEIIGMLISDSVIRRVGQSGIILISGAALAISVALAALTPSPLLFALLISVGGIFSGCIWGAATPLAVTDAPPHLQATAIGIVLAAFVGAGFAIGALVGGIALDVLGGGSPFWLGAAFLALGSGYFYLTRQTAQP